MTKPIFATPRSRSTKIDQGESVMTTALKLLVKLPLTPFIAIQMVRRDATIASVTLLLISISALNIIWGYPWTGMFSVCIALLLVGGVFNRMLRPILRLDFSLPASVPAGESCRVVTHATNIGHFPAFDVSIGFQNADPRYARRKPKWFDTTRGSFFEAIGRKKSVSADSFVQFHQRGIQRVPDVHIASSFPFHIFHCTRVQKSEAKIAVTPALLRQSEDNEAQMLLNAVGAWSQRLLMGGDELQYLGSREYQAGMPVRRWDFQSWARLGRPIVREFQSPSVRSVTIIVDTACDGSSESLAVVERVLSLAATVIVSLTSKSVSTRLYVSCESTEKFEEDFGRPGGLEAESMLIRLAAADTLPTKLADQRIIDVAETNGAQPTLMLTSRTDAKAVEKMRGKWECICVGASDSSDQDTRSKRRVDPSHTLASRSAKEIVSPVSEGV